MKYFIEYEIEGHASIVRTGPYNGAAVDYHYADIESFDGVKNVRVLEVEHAPTKREPKTDWA